MAPPSSATGRTAVWVDPFRPGIPPLAPLVPLPLLPLPLLPSPPPFWLTVAFVSSALSWHWMQRPFPLKMLRPSCSCALRADVFPSRNASKRVWSETRVDSQRLMERPQKREKLFSITVKPPTTALEFHHF